MEIPLIGEMSRSDKRVWALPLPPTPTRIPKQFRFLHSFLTTDDCPLSTARSGTYCLIKYGWYVIPSGFEVKGFPHPPLRKSFVCNDSRNIIYAKHNIFCRKATSFSERKRKRYLRLWRKMVFLPAVGNTTLRVVVPLPPREGLRIPKNLRSGLHT